eukprot:2283294-Amphidinium_carterae.1
MEHVCAGAGEKCSPNFLVGVEVAFRQLKITCVCGTSLTSWRMNLDWVFVRHCWNASNGLLAISVFRRYQ